jgi:hypothetical protein
MSPPENPTIGITFPGAPSPNSPLEIDHRAAHELVDLTTLFADLLVAGMSAHHGNDPNFEGAGMAYARRACFEGAVVAYGRCFGSGQSLVGGSRLELHNYLRLLSPAQLKVHKRLLELRNKRIGHQVAHQSGHTITVFVGLEQASPTNLHLNNLFVRLETELYDVELLEAMDSICSILRGAIGARIDQLRDELLDEIARDLPGVLAALEAGTAWMPPS